VEKETQYTQHQVRRGSLSGFLALADDYTVDLVEDPAAWLSLNGAAPYDAGALYDAEAPLPPRAETMLSAALR